MTRFRFKEKYPRGRRGSPAKGVVCDKRSEGSNPSSSAKQILNRTPKFGLGFFLTTNTVFRLKTSNFEPFLHFWRGFE